VSISCQQQGAGVGTWYPTGSKNEKKGEEKTIVMVVEVAMTNNNRVNGDKAAAGITRKMANGSSCIEVPSINILCMSFISFIYF
jgi:hypothetical protein